MDDETKWDVPHDYQIVELPDIVTAMETIDGNLFVKLADGRNINMTDWFDSPSHRNLTCKHH